MRPVNLDILGSNAYRTLGLQAGAAQADIDNAARRMRIWPDPNRIPATPWDVAISWERSGKFTMADDAYRSALKLARGTTLEPMIHADADNNAGWVYRERSEHYENRDSPIKLFFSWAFILLGIGLVVGLKIWTHSVPPPPPAPPPTYTPPNIDDLMKQPLKPPQDTPIIP